MHEQLAVAHAIGLISVSEKENRYSSDNTHQWLDENGWEHRNVYIQDNKSKEIYSAELNIANTKDGRKILYDVNKVKKVDDGAVASVPTKNVGMGSPSTSTSKHNISQPSSKSNTKKSLDVNHYMTAAENGDEKTAQKYVDKAAMKWGAYSVDGKTPLKFYHGTQKKQAEGFIVHSFYNRSEATRNFPFSIIDRS
ncbi:MAG: hypothetical protein IJR70_03870 [Eubacterium sp.]|nr:hypothetical protein [Eubacterium sp.]